MALPQPKEIPNKLGALTQMVMQLFDHWGLTYKQRAELLGLSTQTNSTIAGYIHGGRNLSLKKDMQDRVGHLLAIHKCLRTLFPFNKELAYSWPKTPNRYFDGKTPLDVMIEERILGLMKVREYLENYLAS